jgi:hypothetical protein
MSNDVEDRLASVLAAEAHAAPPVGDLLAGVHARARQRGRRRLGATVAMAVVAVVAGTGIVSAVAGHGTDALRTPSPLAHQGDPTSDPLVEGREPALQFPYSPGWLPAGVATTPRLSLGDSGLQASWPDATPGRDGELPGVELWSADRDVSLRGDGVTRRATTFDGRPAVLASTQGRVALGWQETPGRWRVVDVYNRFASEANARRVATQLVEQSFAVASPYTMTLLPRDSVLVRWTTLGWFTFAARDEVATWHDAAAPNVVRLTARRRTDAPAGRGEAVTVQGHRGRLSADPQGQWTLTIELNSQTVLVLNTPAWERADVLRLAEATHYNGGVPPHEG